MMQKFLTLCPVIMNSAEALVKAIADTTKIITPIKPTKNAIGLNSSIGSIHFPHPQQNQHFLPQRLL